MIYWFIGQPGHGKTVLSDLLKEKLEQTFPGQKKIFRIDGDDLRSLTSNQDYSRAGREQNIKRAQTIAQYLHNQGHDVIVSLVAPYRELREEFKERVKDIVEIYVHTSEVRGREKFHSDDFEQPLDNFIDVDTTDTIPAESLDYVFREIFPGIDESGKYKSIFCDLDGTVFVYRKFGNYLTEKAEVIQNSKDFLLDMKKAGHHIVLTTARPESMREFTIRELEMNGIPYHQLVMGLARGTRVLINDRENGSDVNRAISINIERNKGI